MSDKDIIICRCEDITREDVRKCLENGFTTVDDIKRQLRVGMGPCQGQTCIELVKREIADFLREKQENIKNPKTRPVTIGVKLKSIKDGLKDER